MKTKEIIKRIEELRQRIENKRLDEEEPIDPLSRSLYELYKEMAELDEDGIADLHERLTNEDEKSIGTLEQTRRFVKTFANEYYDAKAHGVYKLLGME